MTSRRIALPALILAASGVVGCVASRKSTTSGLGDNVFSTTIAVSMSDAQTGDSELQIYQGNQWLGGRASAFRKTYFPEGPMPALTTAVALREWQLQSSTVTSSPAPVASLSLTGEEAEPLQDEVATPEATMELIRKSLKVMATETSFRSATTAAGSTKTGSVRLPGPNPEIPAAVGQSNGVFPQADVFLDLVKNKLPGGQSFGSQGESTDTQTGAGAQVADSRTKKRTFPGFPAQAVKRSVTLAGLVLAVSSGTIFAGMKVVDFVGSWAVVPTQESVDPEVECAQSSSSFCSIYEQEPSAEGAGQPVAPSPVPVPASPEAVTPEALNQNPAEPERAAGNGPAQGDGTSAEEFFDHFRAPGSSGGAGCDRSKGLQACLDAAQAAVYQSGVKEEGSTLNPTVDPATKMRLQSLAVSLVEVSLGAPDGKAALRALSQKHPEVLQLSKQDLDAVISMATDGLVAVRNATSSMQLTASGTHQGMNPAVTDLVATVQKNLAAARAHLAQLKSRLDLSEQIWLGYVLASGLCFEKERISEQHPFVHFVTDTVSGRINPKKIDAACEYAAAYRKTMFPAR